MFAVKKMKKTNAEYQSRTRAQEVRRQFRKNKGAMTALFFLCLLFLMAISIDFWLPKEKVVGMNFQSLLQPPSSEHWFGTDEMGRDLFWRVLYASRYSLAIGVVSVAIGAAIGVPLGACAAYFGGAVEDVIMRLNEVFAAIPSILMAIVVVASLGTGTVNLMIAVGISSAPGILRITRASVLTVKNEDYIEAARALGKSHLYIIFKQILPNCLSPIIVQFTLRIANAIISASSLSFLGLGVQPPTPEWGALLNAGNLYTRMQPYLTLFPGLAIMVTVLAFNLVGDGLRDAMDPKLRK